MYCPSCAGEYREGYFECADCKVPLVERLPADAPPRRRLPRFPTIPKQHDDRPALLRSVPILGLLSGIGALLFLLASFCGLGTYTVAGKVVSASEAFSRGAIPACVLAFVSFAVAIVVGKELPWSRPFIMLFLLLVAVGQVWSDGWEPSSFGFVLLTITVNVPSGVLGLLYAGWYLYGKSNVRAYYQSLEAPQRTETMSA
jgi:hypothetical protein